MSQLVSADFAIQTALITKENYQFSRNQENKVTIFQLKPTSICHKNRGLNFNSYALVLRIDDEKRCPKYLWSYKAKQTTSDSQSQQLAKEAMTKQKRARSTTRTGHVHRMGALCESDGAKKVFLKKGGDGL